MLWVESRKITDAIAKLGPRKCMMSKMEGLLVACSEFVKGSRKIDIARVGARPAKGDLEGAY